MKLLEGIVECILHYVNECIAFLLASHISVVWWVCARCNCHIFQRRQHKLAVHFNRLLLVWNNLLKALLTSHFAGITWLFLKLINCKSLGYDLCKMCRLTNIFVLKIVKPKVATKQRVELNSSPSVWRYFNWLIWLDPNAFFSMWGRRWTCFLLFVDVIAYYVLNTWVSLQFVLQSIFQLGLSG
jgi:hypothetical protein